MSARGGGRSGCAGRGCTVEAVEHVVEDGERSGGEVPAVDGEQHEGQRASLTGRGVGVGVRGEGEGGGEGEGWR